MKLDTVSPQWTYKSDVEALTGMSSVQLLVWPQGVCVSGHDEDGTTMIAKAFAFQQQTGPEMMNAIFLNEPLLAGPQPIGKVWIAEPRTLLVPYTLYNEAIAAEWLSAAHYIEKDELVLVNEPVPGELYAVFPLKQNLYTALQQFFPEGKIGTFSNRRINCVQKANTSFIADIILLGNMAMFSFEEDGKLLSQYFTAYETTEDIVYRVAEVSRLNNHSVNDTSVIISGVLTDLNNISTELSAYYPNTELCDQATTLNFLTKLSLCAL